MVFTSGGVYETAGFAAFVLKILTVSHFPTEFGASPHNPTVSLWRCNLGELGTDCTIGARSPETSFGLPGRSLQDKSGFSLSGGLRNGWDCGVHIEIFDRFAICY